ncbi:MAG: hypothetical protein ACK2UL_06355 [Anaerolineae bacterium]
MRRVLVTLCLVLIGVLAPRAASHSTHASPFGAPTAHGGARSVVAAGPATLELEDQVGGATWAGEVYEGTAVLGAGPRLVRARLPNPEAIDSRFELLVRSDLLPHIVTSVAVDSGRAYAGMYDWGLAVVRMTEEAGADGDLELLGSVAMKGSIGPLAVDRDLVYVAAGRDGVRVVDATDPSAPREVDLGQTPGAGTGLGYVGGVAVSGGRLLVACGGSYDRPDPGLRVLDVTQTGAPEVGDLTTPGDAELVVADDRWAYVIHAGSSDNGRQALWVIDLADPESPRLAREVLLTDVVWDLALDGDLLHVAADDYGVITYDVSDPESPRLQGFTAAGLALAVRGSQGVMIVLTGGGPVRAYDMRQPRQPVQLQAFHGVGHAADVAGASAGPGGHIAPLLVAEWSHWPGGALKAVDVGVGSVPALVGADYVEQWQEAVAVSPTAAFLGGYDDTLRIYDLTAEGGLGALKILMHGPGHILDMAVEGDLLLAALDLVPGGALWVVDAAEPSAPYEVVRFLVPDVALGLTVADGLAFVAAGDAGLLVFDPWPPEEARLVGGLDGLGYARGVAVYGSHAFVATDEAGLAVVDVTNPEEPLLAAQLPRDEEIAGALDVVTDGAAAYVAAAESGVAVVDVRRPLEPRLVETHDSPGATLGVLLSDERLYAADDVGGVLLFHRTPLGPPPTVVPTREPTTTPTAAATAPSPASPTATAGSGTPTADRPTPTAGSATPTAGSASATADSATPTAPSATATATRTAETPTAPPTKAYLPAVLRRSTVGRAAVGPPANRPAR